MRQTLPNHVGFELVQRHRAGGGQLAGLRSAGGHSLRVGLKVFGAELLVAAHEHGALHQVFQLADVAGQRLLAQPVQGADPYFEGGALVGGAQLSDEVLSEFSSYLSSKNNSSQITANGKQLTGIQLILKSLIGRNLFDKDGYYPNLNEHDNCVLKAIEVLNK